MADSEAASPTSPTSPPTPTPGPTPCGPHVPKSLEDIPTETYRRAVQYLEDFRNTNKAPEWDDSVGIVDGVVTFLRIDVLGPAYYEFKVKTQDGSDAGFIMVSATGENEEPI